MKSKIMKLERAIILFLFIISQNISAQEIIDTPTGKLAVKLIDALNTGKKEEQVNFINNFIDLNARQDEPNAVLKSFTDLYNQSGGVQIITIKSGRDPDEVKLTLKSKTGNKMFELFTHLSRESSDKLIGFIFKPLDSPTPSKAIRSSWSETKLSESLIIKEIESHIDMAVKQDQFSGVVYILKENQALVNKAYGFANKDKRVLNKRDTKFNLGSMNKMFTGVAISQLVQAGKISFSDTLSSILPTFPNNETAKKITIYQLLTHTSGLGDFFKPEFFKQRDNYVTLNSYLPLFSQEPLQFEPGKGWSYSNAGYIVLGLIIEKISGESYFEYVRDHIFKPSGMNNTDSYERDVIIPNMALGYVHNDDKDPQHKMPRQLNTNMLPVKGSSAGGGYSTADDMLKFCQALLENRLLSKKFTEIVTSGKVDDHHPNSKYAYGFMEVSKNGKFMIGHNGGGPGINGYVNMLSNGFTVIVLSNYSPPSADGLAKEISDFLIIQ